VAKRKYKMTCRVTFESPDRHLHRATVRSQRHIMMDNRALAKLIKAKTGKTMASVFSMECSDSSTRPLPHSRRAGR
jgi:hypothetical protein